MRRRGAKSGVNGSISGVAVAMRIGRTSTLVLSERLEIGDDVLGVVLAARSERVEDVRIGEMFDGSG